MDLPAGSHLGVSRQLIYRRILDDGAFELCEISVASGGLAIAGRIVSITPGGLPAFATYRLECSPDLSRCSSVRAECVSGGESKVIALEASGDGRWRLNGTPAPALDGCTDPDLEWSPITNVFPMARLGTAAGTTMEIRAAWLRFPLLTVEPAVQTYERLAPNRALYRSGTFQAEITADASGVPEVYAGVWKRIAEWRNS